MILQADTPDEARRAFIRWLEAAADTTAREGHRTRAQGDIRVVKAEVLRAAADFWKTVQFRPKD